MSLSPLLSAMAVSGDAGIETRGSLIDVDHNSDKSESNQSGLDWKFFWHSWEGGSARPGAVYFFQVFLIYIIVITCIVNLSLGKDEQKIWIVLLSSSLGYLLPNPSIKPLRNNNNNNNERR